MLTDFRSKDPPKFVLHHHPLLELRLCMTTRSGTSYHLPESQPSPAMDLNTIDALMTRIDQTITLRIEQVNQWMDRMEQTMHERINALMPPKIELKRQGNGHNIPSPRSIESKESVLGREGHRARLERPRQRRNYGPP